MFCIEEELSPSVLSHEYIQLTPRVVQRGGRRTGSRARRVVRQSSCRRRRRRSCCKTRLLFPARARVFTITPTKPSRRSMECATPEVAVCIVGQLRTAARERAQHRIREAWDRVGRSCVDIFLSIGIEPVVATQNHAAYPAASHSNASALANVLKPIEWHVSAIPMATAVAPSLDCHRREEDAAHGGMTLCHKGPSVETSLSSALPCTSDECTHCAVTSYFGHAERVSSCALMVQTAAKRLGRKYKYFVHHRPDIFLFGLPPYAEWRFPRHNGGDPGAQRAALFCAPLPQAPPSDFFGIFAYDDLPLVIGLSNFTRTCQSRRRNVGSSSKWCNDRGWPAWHTSECLLHAAYGRGGLRVASLTDEYWPHMRRACRILREGGDRAHRGG